MNSILVWTPAVVLWLIGAYVFGIGLFAALNRNDWPIAVIPTLLALGCAWGGAHVVSRVRLFLENKQ